LEPRGYKFKHHSFMFMLDLDELETLEQTSCFFGHVRPRLYSLRDDDHLPGYKGDIKQRVVQYLTETVGRQETMLTKKIMLLTNLRFLDYVFNPVSFFYCFDESDNFIYSVAEVGNTFDEKKLYFLPASGRDSCAALLPKEFYVSPFSDLHLQFDFRLSLPATSLTLSVNEFDQNKPTLVSSVEGKQKSFSDLEILKLTAKYPLVTLRVIAMIHYHAFVLLLKGFHFFPKHNNAHLQTKVLNAHSSIKTKAATPHVEAQKG
jgi:DUF1365 family protein